jgi:hypothetical protein
MILVKCFSLTREESPEKPSFPTRTNLMMRLRCLPIHLLTALFCAGALLAAGKPIPKIIGYGDLHDPDGDCRVTEDDGKLALTVPAKYHDLRLGIEERQS